MKIDVTMRGLAAGLSVSALVLAAACGRDTAPTNTAAPAATSTATSNANASGAASAAGEEGTPALQQSAKEVDAALKKAGYTNLQVSIKSNTIQVKGTVPHGKIQEAQNVVRGAAGTNATMTEIYQEAQK